MQPNRWLDNMLGLCFCEHCVAGAREARASTRAASRRRSRADISAYLASDIDFPADMAEAFWLRRHARRRRPRRYPRLALHGGHLARRRNPRRGAQGRRRSRSSPRWRGRPAAPGTRAATSRALAETAGIIEACFYEPSASAREGRSLRRQAPAARARASCAASCGRRIPTSPRKGEFLAAVDGAARRRRRRARLLQLGPSAPGEPRLDRRRACERRSMTHDSSRARSSPSPAPPAASASGSAASSATRARPSRRSTAATRCNALVDTLGDGRHHGARPPSPTSPTPTAVQGRLRRLRRRRTCSSTMPASRAIRPSPRTDPAELGRRTSTANLNGAYACAHAVLPRHGGAARRHRSSMSARSTASRALGDPAYSAAKAGMISLTKVAGAWNMAATASAPTSCCPARCARRSGTSARPRTRTCSKTLRALVSARPHRRARRGRARRSRSSPPTPPAPITGAALPVDCGLTAGNIVMARELTLEDF